ncbi:EAL domain-containing protein [Rhizobium sp. CFBP 8762]|uniref:putative bifunctional diguanylate cyclase/phosphodiesterase n=1 Tax=Rhizobium sp. CFBP 8762 TaxID=2775279 RepID=UPI00178672E8|nr:EAL domain-containing protein [Rhizobium sp. CFBP 8762]MBD8556477.1 EAL domain-containing protein [Rhizobium sp. CFBP 8762]
MYQLLSHIGMHHNLWLLALATLICTFGCVLCMRLFVRAKRSTRLEKANWVFLAAMIGGSAIWTTHVVCMLGYSALQEHGYDPILILLSLLAAIAVTLTGLLITALPKAGFTVELGGAVIGLGIAVMHYLGIAAYQFSGAIQWDYRLVALSVIFGVVFGMIATNRVARPVTRFCKHGGAVGLCLAILFTHFLGMGAMTPLPGDYVAQIETTIPSSSLLVLVITITAMMLSLGVATYSIDASSSRTAQENVLRLSAADPLTGLANRSGFRDHVRSLLRRHGDTTGRVAVLLFNLDRFKEVNEVHGHAAGDAVLRDIGQRMSLVFGENEFVARMSADEFAGVTVNFLSRNEVKTLAARVLEEISRPTEWEGLSLQVNAAVGIALFPSDGGTKEELLAKADLALHRAKSKEHSPIQFYDASMDDVTRDRSVLALDMRYAIERGEFELYYQRQNSAINSVVTGLEVLLRWRHPVRGFVSPYEFIGIAERTGYINEIGNWVLRTACLEAASWTVPLKIAVNVAPSQLSDPTLPQRIAQVLKETGLPASRLEVEITESGLLGDQRHALHIMRQIKALGVSIAMDDYGTGYSSLSTLQSFPFDKIKIDRAFIKDVTTNRQSAAIVRSTLILAQSLDVPVLAEGVETTAQMQFLCREGCNEVQGYLFGKPAPVSELRPLVGCSAEKQTESTAYSILPKAIAI